MTYSNNSSWEPHGSKQSASFPTQDTKQIFYWMCGFCKWHWSCKNPCTGFNSEWTKEQGDILAFVVLSQTENMRLDSPGTWLSGWGVRRIHCWDLFSAQSQCWEDLASRLDQQVENLSLGCQEFQSLLPKQSGSQRLKVEGAGPHSVFNFYLICFLVELCIETSVILTERSNVCFQWGFASHLACHLMVCKSHGLMVWNFTQGCQESRRKFGLILGILVCRCWPRECLKLSEQVQQGPGACQLHR